MAGVQFLQKKTLSQVEPQVPEAQALAEAQEKVALKALLEKTESQAEESLTTDTVQ